MNGGDWFGLVALLVVVTVILGAWMAVVSARLPAKQPDPGPGVLSRMRMRVIVTLKTGEVFAGILFEADERSWVLRSSEALHAADDGSNLPVDGEIIVLTADIAYAQRP